MGLIKALIGLFLITTILGAGYYIYDNYLSGEIQEFQFPGYNNNQVELDLEGVGGEVKQFYDNMRFNHNKISYFVNANCQIEKKNKVHRAFEIINEKTEGLISFYEDFESRADIVVGCSPDSYEKEENIFVAGEGGPTHIINSSMPVIIRGKVLLYDEIRGACDEPLLELHELLHVFGYDHINNENDLMYPYINCDQEVNSDLIANLISLYSIEPFVDIYFEDIDANKQRYAGKWYLNFNVSISNQGILDANDLFLKIYQDDILVQDFDLELVKLGGGKDFFVNNLALDSSSNNIKFELETSTNEPNKKNNALELEV